MFQQEKKYQAQGLLPNSGEKKKKKKQPCLNWA